jgi:hypothetical protein
MAEHSSSKSDNELQMDWRAHRDAPLSLKQACAKLKEKECSTAFEALGGSWRIRTDAVQLPGLSPVEDALAWGEITVHEGTKWHYWGVFDGHK